ENGSGDYPAAVRSQMSQFAEQAARERRGQYISFLMGDGGRLPFPDRSVGEIFMSNLLNANIGDKARHTILTEAQRVIEDEGNVVIRANWHTDVWPHDKMIDLVSNYLDVPRSVEADDREYQRLDAQYGAPSEVAAPDGYYLIAGLPWGQRKIV
ncbi:MAG: methyltransferase domain-containing protein, partial [Patescibacteria group bacterium]